MKKLVLFLTLICSFQILGQEKPVALKFDEFFILSSSEESAKDKSQRIKRFAAELKRNPSMKGIIIEYVSRKQPYYHSGVNKQDPDLGTIGYEFEENGVSRSRLVKVLGGLREFYSLEFWLLPQGVEMPVPSPSFKESEKIICPRIRLYSDRKNITDSIIELSVEFESGYPATNLSYEWIISEGKIINGANSPKMTLDISGISKSLASVKAVVKGLNPECENQEVITIGLNSFPYKWDEFDSYNEVFKIRLPILQELLEKSPNLEARLFYYPSRQDPARSEKIAVMLLNKGIAFMKFPREKITAEFGGYRDELRFEIWLYPKGTEPPKPTPTVDAKFVQRPKARKK